VALSNVTAEEAAALLEDLERVTGLDLEWKDGVLAVAGDPTKAAGGSATARHDLLAAINAEETISVRGGRLGGALADTPGKASPATMPPIIRMDFQRIFGIQYAGIPRLTFGVGMIFLHELQHALFGKSDDSDRKDPQGPTVRHMNSIRSELGLPLRAQYEAKVVQRAGIKLRAELNFVRDGKAVGVASWSLR